MPTNTSSTQSQRSKSSTSARSQAKATDRAVAYVRQTSGRAIDVPVGAVLTARERITGAVEPWTRSETRGKELRGLRRQVSTELDRFERRGGQARRRAADRVSKRVRKVETTVQQSRVRVEDGVKKAQVSVQERVSSLA